LDVIRESDGTDLWAITSKVRAEREQVKEALDKLDYDVYVIRRFQGDGWTARNLYVAFDRPHAKVADAFETIVRRFLAAYGPVPTRSVDAGSLGQSREPLWRRLVLPPRQGWRPRRHGGDLGNERMHRGPRDGSRFPGSAGRGDCGPLAHDAVLRDARRRRAPGHAVSGEERPGGGRPFPLDSGGLHSILRFLGPGSHRAAGLRAEGLARLRADEARGRPRLP